MEMSSSKKATATIALALFVLFLSGFLVWFLSSPLQKNSISYWVGLALMAFPVYAATEAIGTFGLNASFIQALPKLVRITFGVLWGLFCLVFISAFAYVITLIVGLH